MPALRSLTPIVSGLLLAALLGLGTTVLPRAVTGIAQLHAADDPVRLSELRLAEAATEARIASEIGDALDQGDADLARSFLDLADGNGIPVQATLLARVGGPAAVEAHQAGTDFLDGATSGRSESWSGTLGAFTADVVGIGDLRDLWREGNRFVEGEPYDTVVLGLSVAGIALTGVTIASLLPSGGASAAAKMPVARGLGILKSARRTGLLSRELADKLGGMALALVDRAAVGQALTAARALDLAAARQAIRSAVRPGALRIVSGMGADMVALETRLGQRGAVQAIGVARDAAELNRARRLADGLGRRTRATLKLLGASALVLGEVTAMLLQAVWIALAWTVATTLMARRLGLALGRLLVGRRRPPLRAPTFMELPRPVDQAG